MARNPDKGSPDYADNHGDDFYRNDFYERLDSLQDEYEDEDAPYGELSGDDALINNPYLSRYDYFREQLEDNHDESSGDKKHYGEIIRDQNAGNGQS